MSVAEIAKRLGVTIDTIYGDLNHKHEQVLSAVSEYGQFRRRENERELEALKALYASYIFHPNVVIGGTEVDKDGKTRVIEFGSLRERPVFWPRPIGSTQRCCAFLEK